jgi:tetratricopeptide (TPR) repeat protein
MAGKITTVLAKKEAEAYRSQGLHQEAMNLFAGLLASSSRMDPAIEEAIQSQIQGIRQEMKTTDAQRQRALTPAEIRRIRDGWGTQATEADTLVCAQAFLQIGSYSEALGELRKLLQGNAPKRIHIAAAADCLVRMHQPELLAQAAELLAREISPETKTAWAAQLVMAKHMEADHHDHHALALYRHLAAVPALAAAIQPRIDAVATRLQARGPIAPPPPAGPPAEKSSLPDTAGIDSPSPGVDATYASPPSERSFSLGRLRHLFKKSAQ